MGATMSGLRVFFCLIASSILTGCAVFGGTVFDPIPYRPTIENEDLFQFSSLKDSADKLQTISDGYADKRDDLMRQQLLFDLPLMGVAAAAIVSGIYGGSKDLILGLGLGTAGIAGGRLYFGPQGKITAYNEAALSLGCASHFARGVDASFHTKQNATPSVKQQGEDALGQLEQNLKEAEAVLLRQTTTPEDRSRVLPARDRAQKAFADLSAALGLLSTATAQMEDFAYTVFAATTSKVVTGVQNLDAALKLMREAPTHLPPSGAKTQAEIAATEDVDVQGADDLISDLQFWSARAETITKLITEKWMELSKCAVANS